MALVRRPPEGYGEMMNRSSLAIAATFALLTLLAPPVVQPLRADTVWTSGGQLKIAPARIIRIQGDRLYYEMGGRETSRELGQIYQIEVDGEPVLNAAEEAWVKEDWNAAVDGYVKSARSTAAGSKAWLAQWSTVRLIQSANKAGRLDAAVSGYLVLLSSQPDLAGKYKPTLPEKSTFLDSAVTQTEAKLKEPRLPDAAKRALLGFLLELHRARGDLKKAAEVAEQLGDSGALSPQDQAELALGQARIALDQKNYAEVARVVESRRSIFVDPNQQADALFLVAEAKSKLAKDDKNALKDAALAYMRVVAHFSNVDGKPRVAASLLRTADLYQQLDEPQTALKLYERLIADFPTDPAAREAKQKADALKTGGKAN